jgi:hypothetical protein
MSLRILPDERNRIRSGTISMTGRSPWNRYGG